MEDNNTSVLRRLQQPDRLETLTVSASSQVLQ